MKTYIWKSVSFLGSHYNPGWLIATADTTDEAREKLRVEFKRLRKKHCPQAELWRAHDWFEADITRRPDYRFGAGAIPGKFLLGNR